LHDAYFETSALKAAGFTVKDMRAAGLDVGEIKRAGFPAQDFADAGVPPGLLYEAGFAEQELRNLGFNDADVTSAVRGNRWAGMAASSPNPGM